MTAAGEANAAGPGALDALIRPANVVIVGASNKGTTVRIRADLERTGYDGDVYPVNPRRDTLWGAKCYPSVAAVPAQPDHVMISVPAAAVPAALSDAIDGGARSVAIHAVGFGEGDSEEGRALAREVREIAARASVPVAGPSFGGVFRQDCGLMTISLTRGERTGGSPVALVGQSGGVLMFTFEALVDRGINPSTLIASGSELLLSCADYIRYLAEDETVKVIGCFIESIKDVGKFRAAALAARANGKHVVVLKVGASDGARAAALAHTGSIVGSLAAFEAFATELGVVTVRTQDELIDAIELQLNASTPLTGPRIGVVTHSGGLKDLLMDYSSAQGIVFPALEQSTLDHIAGLLGPGSSLGNPLDTGFPGLTNPDIHRQCVEAVAADPNIDVVLVQDELPRSPLKAREERYLRNLSALSGTLAKPVGSISLVSYSLTDHARAVRAELPGIFVLQEASRAIAVVTRAGATAAAAAAAERKPAIAAQASPQAGELRQRLRELQGPRPVTLSEHDSKELLAAYGIPVTRERTANTADEAVAAADELGYPVVLKVSGGDVAHKSDVGGVLLGLGTAGQVREGFAQLAALRTGPTEVLVAEFVTGDVEVMLGVQRDPEVGPVVAVGSGGTAVEILADAAVAMPAIDQAGAAALFARTRAGRLVAGHRGKTLDCDGVAAALASLAALTRDLGELLEAVDINPLLVATDRVCALDGLVVLAPVGQ